MRTLVDLPHVTCQLGLSDGTADIAMFQDCARNANWTNNEINVVIVKAVYGSSDFDRVGIVLQRYCSSGADAQASSYAS
jgi:hypothetical protein